MRNVQNKSIKEWIKSHYRLYEPLLFIKSKEARVQSKLRRLNHDPQKHVDYLKEYSLMYGYGRAYPRTQVIDLREPQLFNEKLLWLKYYCYNQDPLVAKCYDKYLVREYIKERGCEEYLNTLYSVEDNVDDIPWDDLPDEFIIKKTNGSGNHVIKRKGEPFDKNQSIELLKRSSRNEYQMHIASGDLFANKSKQRYICEKLLEPPRNQSEMDDYKFYCFNGKPLFLLYIFNRKSKMEYEKTFKRIDWENDCKLIDQNDYFLNSASIDLKPPDHYLEMIDLCLKLSKPFPFVRVDLYEQEEKPVFGELTFSPAGGHVLHHAYKADGTINMECLTDMGSLLDISGMMERLEMSGGQNE